MVTMQITPHLSWRSLMQESKIERAQTREDELGMYTLEDSAFLPSETSDPSSANQADADDKPRYRTQDKL